MKTVWILFAFTLLFLIGVSIWKKTNIQDENVDSRHTVAIKANNTAGGATKSSAPENLNTAGKNFAKYKSSLPVSVLRDSLVQFALKQQGLPYVASGTERSGFDCSGFVHFAFARFGIEVPHSSALLAQEGVYLPIEKAHKADLVIFTGTNEADRTPGHVGIVISNPSEPLAFVHASSNGGVKVSKVDSTGYARRFLQVRRIF
jgi:cell wall-associated NlpC family hydrolase